MLMRLF